MTKATPKNNAPKAFKWEGDFIVNGINTAPEWLKQEFEAGNLTFIGQGALHIRMNNIFRPIPLDAYLCYQEGQLYVSPRIPEGADTN
jgi:hypothetical protein